MYNLNELIGVFDTEGSARTTADIYDIELLSFENGVAVFATKKDPHYLIKLGRENGWPELFLNNKYKALKL